MKTYYQILIILFVLFSFIIVKDDIQILLNNKNFNTNKSSSVNLSTKFNSPVQQEPSKLKPDTPGALRVVDNLLNINSNKVELSAKNIVAITNKYRKENGDLTPLVEQNKLNLSAEKKLQDMFNNQYFEHESPSGLGVGDLGEQNGYNYILIGENLAMGNFNNDTSLVNAWMASPGHRENILNKNYIDIGVAVGRGIYNGQKTWMAVQHFGTPQSVCPAIDKVRLGIINLNQNKILEMTKELSVRQDKIKGRMSYEGSTINEQIDIYNLLVNSYNNLINQTKKETEIYNNQVKEFNLCLLNYQ